MTEKVRNERLFLWIVCQIFDELGTIMNSPSVLLSAVCCGKIFQLVEHVNGIATLTRKSARNVLSQILWLARLEYTIILHDPNIFAW